jgi:hypothetical protein
MNRFEQWWYEEGSKAPQENGYEEHCKKMCAIAWANGAYVEREEWAKEFVGMGECTAVSMLEEREQE